MYPYTSWWLNMCSALQFYGTWILKCFYVQSGGLQSIRSQRVGPDSATNTHTHLPYTPLTEIIVIFPTLQIRKLRLREDKRLTLGHTVCKQQSHVWKLVGLFLLYFHFDLLFLHSVFYPWHDSLLHIQYMYQSSSVQSLSRVQLFATPWITACQASLSITNSQSSLRLMSIKSVMPSSHLILCCPLILLSPIPLSIWVFSNESTLRMRWPKYWSFSFSISPSNEHPGLIFA